MRAFEEPDDGPVDQLVRFKVKTLAAQDIHNLGQSIALDHKGAEHGFFKGQSLWLELAEHVVRQTFGAARRVWAAFASVAALLIRVVILGFGHGRRFIQINSSDKRNGKSANFDFKTIRRGQKPVEKPFFNVDNSKNPHTYSHCPLFIHIHFGSSSIQIRTL